MLRRLLLLVPTSTTALALRPFYILASLPSALSLQPVTVTSPVLPAFVTAQTSPRHSAHHFTIRATAGGSSPRQQQEEGGEEILANLRVPELKDKLRALGLKVSGRKSELIERLQSHYGTSIASSRSMSPTKRKAAATTADDEKKGTSAKYRKKSPAKKGKTKKAKAADHQRQTERTDIPKLWDGDAATRQSGSYTMKIMSWNVAGLRALLRNYPDVLPGLARKYGLDVICLQETKLQEAHIDDPKLKIGGHLLEEEGYDAHYSCSTARKGYAGTAVFVKRRSADVGNVTKSKKQASLSSFFKSGGGAANGDSGDKHRDSEMAKKTNEARDMENIGSVDVKNLIPTISYGIGEGKHDGEGRSITLDFPFFTMTNLYVPNSGQKLDRLSYRTKEWDTDLLAYIQKKERDRNVPIIWLGDLNVAHTAKETWNEGAKHLAKSAGTTPEERASFQQQLDAGYVDAFRELHPDALGHYTYWSQRAGNREPNKGLRLDYFVCSKDMMKDGNESHVVVRDSYMIPDQKGSDHCPVVLELEIKHQK